MASISIILFHMSPLGLFRDVSLDYPNLLTMISAPAFHASIFFLLGGFIYYCKYLNSSEDFDNKRFLKSRFMRLYPLHFITTIIFAFYIFFIVAYGKYDYAYILKSLVAHLSLTWAFFPDLLHSINQPSWAISSFFIAYLLFPYAMKYIRKMDILKLAMAVVGWLVVIMLWWLLLKKFEGGFCSYRFFHIFPPIRALEFFLGMMLGRLVQIQSQASFSISGFVKKCFNVRSFFKESKVLYIFNTLILISIIYFIIKSSIYMIEYNGYWSWIHYHAFLPLLYMLALYFIVTTDNLLNKILSFRLIRELGKSSFTPYLLHVPLISIGADIYVSYFHRGDIFYSPWVVSLMLFIFYFLCYIFRKLRIYAKA